MNINGKIDFLVNGEETNIRIYDDDACCTVVEVVLTSEQLSSALSRMSHTPCKSVGVFNTDRLGKKMEHKELVFEIPKDIGYARGERKTALAPLAEKACPKGWESDNTFSSQGTFFSEGDKRFCRTTIRRWV